VIETTKTIALIVFWVLAMGGLINPALWLLLACAVAVSTFMLGLWAAWTLFGSEQDY
jgi:hypothetical protein